MDKRRIIALSGAILLIGIASVAFFMVQPPGEGDHSAPQPAKDQGAPENSARTETGVSPLLLILMFLVVLVTTTKIGRILARRREEMKVRSQRTGNDPHAGA